MTAATPMNRPAGTEEPADPPPLAAWIAEARALLKLGLPLAATQLMQMAMMTTDLIMLGRVGPEAIAAAALGNTLFFFAWLMGMGPAAAVSPMIAQILGARPKDRKEIRSVTRMGFLAVGLAGIPLSAMLLATEDILTALGQSPALAQGAALFTRPLSLGLFFSLGFQVLRSHTTALSAPNAPLVVMVLSVFFNALADYALIFGHFGFPPLGVLGSGLATTASFAFSFVAMLVLIRLNPQLRSYRIFRRFGRIDAAKLKEIFRLGLPIGVTMSFEVLLFNCSMLVMGLFGTEFVAAHQIALNVPSLTFMVPLGIAMAATIRVGLAAGAHDGAGVRRAGYCAMLVSVLFMTASALVIALFPRAIAVLYFGAGPIDETLIALTVSFLYVAAAFQIVDALQVVAALSLRGLKDAQFPMWLAGASYWLIGAPAGLLLAFSLGLQGLGIWLGLALALAAAATMMTARFWFLTRA
jgi:multidrug resistance protein, MATE family